MFQLSDEHANITLHDDEVSMHFAYEHGLQVMQRIAAMLGRTDVAEELVKAQQLFHNGPAENDPTPFTVEPARSLGVAADRQWVKNNLAQYSDEYDLISVKCKGKDLQWSRQETRNYIDWASNVWWDDGSTEDRADGYDLALMFEREVYRLKITRPALQMAPPPDPKLAPGPGESVEGTYYDEAARASFDEVYGIFERLGIRQVKARRRVDGTVTTFTRDQALFLCREAVHMMWSTIEEGYDLEVTKPSLDVIWLQVSKPEPEPTEDQVRNLSAIAGAGDQLWADGTKTHG